MYCAVLANTDTKFLNDLRPSLMTGKDDLSFRRHSRSRLACLSNCNWKINIFDTTVVCRQRQSAWAIQSLTHRYQLTHPLRLSVDSDMQGLLQHTLAT